MDANKLSKPRNSTPKVLIIIVLVMNGIIIETNLLITPTSILRFALRVRSILITQHGLAHINNHFLLPLQIPAENTKHYL